MSVISNLNNNEKLALYRRIAKELNISGNGYDEFIKKNHIDSTKIGSIYLRSFGLLELGGGVLSYIFRNDKSKLDVSKFENQNWLKQYGNDLSLLLELFNELEFTDKNIRNLKIRCEEVLREVKVKTIYTVSEICDNLSNPLDNEEFMKKVLGELLKNNDVDVRDIWLSRDKRPDNSMVINKSEISLRLVKYAIKRLILIIKNKRYDLLSINLQEKLKKNNNYVEVLEKLEKISEDDFRKIAHCLINSGQSQILTTISGYNDIFGFVLKSIVDDFSLNSSEDKQGRETFYNMLEKNVAAFRIYMNPSSSYFPLFIEAYIQKCLKAGIGYCFKYQGERNISRDGLVLYLSMEQLPIVVRILNEIEYEHPEWIDSFGTPLSNTGILNNSYYGICHVGAVTYKKESKKLVGNNVTYNDYCNRIFLLAFESLIAKIAIDKNLVTDVNDREYLRQLAKLVYVKYNQDDDKSFRNDPNEISFINYRDSRPGFTRSILSDAKKIIKKNDLFNKVRRIYPNLINNSNVLKLFKRRCQHIADGLVGRLGKNQGNICVSKVMDDYCEMERKQLMEHRDEMGGKKRKS